jgi:hypothetical protein
MLFVGQSNGGGNEIDRLMLEFDTSIIPPGAVIVGAKIKLRVQNDQSLTDFDIVVQNGQPTFPHEPVVVGDYLYTQYADNGGSFNTAGLPGTGNYFNIDLNVTGIGWLNFSGLTKFCLRSSKDISSTQQGGAEYVMVDCYLNVGGEPKLEITWTYPGMTTTIVDTACKSRWNYKFNADFNTARNAAAGDGVQSSNLVVGVVGGYIVKRAYLILDTSVIPAGAIIDSVKLKLYFLAITNTTGGSVTCRVLNGQPTYPHDPVVDADFDRTLYADDGGDHDYRADATGAYIDIALNATGMGWINSGGETKLCLQNLESDINGVDFGGGNQFTVDFSVQPGQLPKLEIMWRYAGATDAIATDSGGIISAGDGGASGSVYKGDATYLTAYNAAVGDAAISQIINGQVLSGGSYYIYRNGVIFDTSTLPVGAFIKRATLYMFMSADSSVTDFDLTILNGQPTYPSNPIVVGDYDRTLYAGNGGSLNTSLMVLNQYNRIDLNATGISWINAGGTTKLFLRSSNDISATPPVGNEYIQFGTVVTGQPPLLIIEYGVSDTLYQTDATYLTAHDAATGIFYFNSDLMIGQSMPGSYYVWRTGLVFDTSSIPAGSVIIAAKITMRLTWDQTITDFDVVVQNGQPTYPHDPIVVGDYLYSQYSDNGGSFGTNGLGSVTSTFDINLNSTGLGWVKPGSITKLMLLSSEDIAASAPGANNEVFGVNHVPTLELMWIAGTGGAVSVTTCKAAKLIGYGII